MSEAQIQNKIIKYLNSIGAYTVKTIATNRSGTPDILCCCSGLFIGLEVKTAKGKTSALQEYHIRDIKKSGGISGAVRSIEDVKRLLDGGGYKIPTDIKVSHIDPLDNISQELNFRG